MQFVLNIVNFVKNFILKTVLPFVLMVALVIFGWTWFKKQREDRIFTLKFYNIDGLSKGAPVYLRGLQVGKVVQTFPLINSNEVGVKIMVTDENFAMPKNAHAHIITSIETGGGKVIELQGVTQEMKNEHIGWKGVSPISVSYVSHLMMDLLQMTKDFAQESMKLIAETDHHEYKAKLESSVKNAITSLEYGTIENDIKNEIKQLNRRIKDAEKDPAKTYKAKQAVRDQMKALEKTLSSLANVSEVYKEQNQGGIFHVKEKPKTYNTMDSMKSTRR